MDEREQKALMIAATSKIEKRGNETWIVPSQSRAGKYAVTITAEAKACTCPDFELRQLPCKHVMAVQYVLFREERTEEKPDGTITTTTTEAQAVRVTYAQDWPAYNAAQTTEKAHFLRLLRDLCDGVENPIQQNGRPRLPMSDQVFASAFKVYSGMSARRFSTDVRQAKDDGLISDAPAYNSIIRYMESADLTPILRDLIVRSALPLKAVETDFAIDSTGFTSTQLVGLWQATKYGAKRARQEHDWLKVHAVCGTKTNVITAIEVTERNTQDAPFFRPLIADTAEHFNVERVQGDKAYSSFANLEMVERLGATAYIPFKSYAKASGKSATWDKLFHFYSLHRDEFLAVYHRRSNVESTFSMVKRVFGDFVRSKTRVAQINEILLKVLCHNIRVLIHEMHELGVSGTFPSMDPR